MFVLSELEAPRCLVAGLRNGDGFRFRVVALSGAGDSRAVESDTVRAVRE